MDINAALDDIRSLVTVAETTQDNDSLTEADMNASLADIAISLAEKVSAIDGWMTRGGFAPDAWNR